MVGDIPHKVVDNLLCVLVCGHIGLLTYPFHDFTVRYKLLSASENCGHQPGATPCVHDGDNPEGPFLRRVGNQVFTYQNEAQRSRGEVRASVALTGKWN